MKTAVIGAGSWGTALGAVLADNGHDVWLWARRAAARDEVNHQHTNEQYLPGAVLPASVRATCSANEAAAGCEFAIFVVPSAIVTAVATQWLPLLPATTIVAHAVKGFDHARRCRPSEMLTSLSPSLAARLCVIAGPSHAEEVILRRPTTLVVAAYARATAEVAQDALMTPYLRVYTNPDVVGVELGAALKNIIAFAVGVADGLGFGDNAKAAIMTRGLAEMTRLGVKLGASPLTFAGLSGVGDLIVTCTSMLSRNFRAGQWVGRGKSVEEAVREVGMVVEGVPTTRTALALAKERQVEMPITEALASLLFEGTDPATTVARLMGRAKSHEIEEIPGADMAPDWVLDRA